MEEDRTNTMYITEPAVTSWELFSDSAVQIQYKIEDSHEETNPTVNRVITA